MALIRINFFMLIGRRFLNFVTGKEKIPHLPT